MPVSTYSLRISDAEHAERCERLREHLQQEGLSGVVLFDQSYILYYTGFAFIPTERPMAWVMSAAGEKGMFVPRLEVEHAQANALVDRVEHYPEYPGNPRWPCSSACWTTWACRAHRRGRRRLPLDSRLSRPSLSELTGAAVQTVHRSPDQMMIKSPAELRLIEESCKWGHPRTCCCSATPPSGAPRRRSASASDEATAPC